VEGFFHLSLQIIGPVHQSLLLLALWQLVKSPWSVYGIGLNATQNLATANFIGIIGNAGRLLFSLGLLASGLGLVGLILGNIIAEGLAYCLSAFQFRRLYPSCRPVWGIPDKVLLREMLIFGLHSLMVSIAWRLVYLTDNIVVGYLYGAAAVSIYYLTQMPTTIAFNIINRVHDNASPALNELHTLQEEERLRKAFLRLHRLNNLLALPMGAGVCLLNKQLITLWVGPGQYAGDLMTIALAGFILLTTVNHLTYIFYIASGEILAFGIVGLIEGVVNLGLSVWLGKVIGLAGVMWASIIANLPATALVLYISMYRLRITVPEYLTSCVIRLLLPTAIGYGAGFLAGRLLLDRGWVTFTVQGAVLVAVYGSLVYLVSLTRDERVWVRSRLYHLMHLRVEANTGQPG
jgi:O-antigen/teichoic acid export membrane protein